ncbi:hypothetical protein F4703DRAFT_1936931 [Phycomyces blakesleeanus]
MAKNDDQNIHPLWKVYKSFLAITSLEVYMTIVFTLQAKQQGSKLKFGLQSKPAIMDPISVQCYSVLAVKGSEQEPGLHIGI